MKEPVLYAASTTSVCDYPEELRCTIRIRERALSAGFLQKRLLLVNFGHFL